MNYKDLKVALIAPSNRCLINPRTAEPLGLMYIEGVLQELGITTEMIDTSFTDIIPKADIYAFSGATLHYPQNVALAKKLKNSYTVIGGPHASALPIEAKKDFKAVIVGPGESSIIKVIDDFLGNKKGGIFCEPLLDINSVPIPPRTLLNKIKYNVFPKGTDISASLLTSRGCPMKCAFCASNVIWGRKVIYYSLERIIKEIEYLQNTFNINHFKFIDDILTLNKTRFLELSKLLSKYKIKWFCESRIDTIDDEILEQMKQSGCEYIDLGVESVEDLVLEKIGKRQTSLMAENAIKKIKSHNLKVKIYLIYGLPFESSNIVQNSIDFIEKNNPDSVSLFTLVPYPGTDIWNNPDKYNIKKIYNDFNYYQHSVGGTEDELSWLPSVEYNNRSRELMRDERNKLKKYTDNWNKGLLRTNNIGK